MSHCCFPCFSLQSVGQLCNQHDWHKIKQLHFFLKQRDFLHGFDNLRKLVSVGAIRRFIFSFIANQNFSRDRKAVLLRKWIALVLLVKFRSPQYQETDTIAVIITVNSTIVVTKQPSAERYLANILTSVFLRTFRKLLQRIKKTFREFLQSLQKTPVAQPYLSKIAGFYRSSHRRCSVKKGIHKKVFPNSHENTCFRYSILIKLQA